MGYGAEEIAALINGGAGPQSLFGGADAANQLAQQHRSVADKMTQLQASMEGAWDGPAAGRAQAGAGPMIAASRVSSEHLAAAQELYAGQGRSFGDAKNAIGAGPGPKPESTFLSDNLPFLTSRNEEIDAWNQKAQQVVDSYNTYNGQSTDNSGRWPTDYGKLALPPGGGDISIKQPDTPGQIGGQGGVPVGGQGGPDAGHHSGTRESGPVGGTGHNGPAPTHAASSVAASASGPQHTGTGPGGAPLPPDSQGTRPSADPTQNGATRTPGLTPPGYQPPGVSGRGPGRFSGDLGVGVPYGSGLGQGGTGTGIGTGTGTGAGSGRAGSLLTGSGTGAGPGGSAGSTQGGPGGAARGTGSGLPGEQAGPVRGAGAATGAAGAKGANGMGGGMAPGRGGKGEDDREHKTADYLIEPDPDDALVGKLPRATPPVIGA